MSVALAALPGATTPSEKDAPTRSQVHALIAPYAKASSLHGYFSFGVDLALYVLGIGAVVLIESVWAKIAGGVVAGAALVNLGALLHEAAHRSLVPSRTGNKVLAVISMTLCLFNYRLWIYDHHVLHHASTNVKGHNFLSPISMEEYRAMSRFRRALYRAYHMPAGTGVLLYFLIERWPTVHFWPGKWLPQRFHGSAIRYAALQAAFLIALLATLTVANGSVVAALLCGFVLPYLIWFATFSMTVFLQHTHPEVRWFRDTADSPPDALSVHVGIPHWINHMSHYGLEHPVHHVSAAIPHYRLKQAQAALAEIAAPPVIFMRFTPANLRNVVTKCRLYDYEAHAWTDFDGTVTARPAARGTMRPSARRTRDLLPDRSDAGSPGMFFPQERAGSAAEPTAASDHETA